MDIKFEPDWDNFTDEIHPYAFYPWHTPALQNAIQEAFIRSNQNADDYFIVVRPQGLELYKKDEENVD